MEAAMGAYEQQLARARRVAEVGRIDEAVGICRELLRRRPAEVEALCLIGGLLCLEGKSTGLPYLRRAAAAAPNAANIHSALAMVLAGAGQLAEAIECCQRAVALAPQSAEANQTHGLILKQAGDLAGAERAFRRAVECDPGLAAAYNNLANVLAESGRGDEAIEAYRQAVAREPGMADAWANLGAALLAADRTEEARDACRRAVEANPRHSAAWLTMGSAASAEGEWDAALAHFDAALACGNGTLAARYNRSLARLATDDCRGWADYRLRHEVEPTIQIRTGLPRWSGESLAGKTILIRREQGIGTQVMFSGYLPLVANRAERVVVECDGRLRPLLARTYPDIGFLTAGEIWPEARAGEASGWKIVRPDVEAAIGDLAGDFLGTEAARSDEGRPWTEGAAKARLTCDPRLVAKWRERLARLGGGMKVGVSWRGGGTEAARRRRSTTLHQWRRVLDVAAAPFVSLQYGDVEEELRQAGAAEVICRWKDFDPRNDLDDLAALATALDLVISVDNSTAHLAAAAGARVWTLLPAASDWRWTTRGSETPWYGRMELVRWDEVGWASIFSKVAQRLSRNIQDAGQAATAG